MTLNTRTKLLPVLVLTTLLGCSSGDNQSNGPISNNVSSPVAPSGIVAVPSGQGVIVEWNTVDGADTYNLYWSTVSGAGTNGMKISNANSPYTHIGLATAANYYYVVTAENTVGESAASVEVMATTAPAIPTIPVAPTNLKAIPGDQQIVIDWDTLASADSYNLYWNTTGGVTILDNQIANATPPFNHNTLINGTPYYYIITAVNQAGESAPTNEVSATPKISVGVLTTPKNIQALPLDSQVTVSWNTVSGASAYNIYWNTAGDVNITDNSILGVTSPYLHLALTNGTTYYYRVTAVSSAGESTASVEVATTPDAYEIYYVSSLAVDNSGDGLSPATAKQTIPAAVGAAAMNTPALVRVNTGTYNVNSDNTVTPTHLVMREGVSLYGGYSEDFGQRDPEIFTTVITDNSAQVKEGTGLVQINSAVEANDSNMSARTLIDGFAINGSTQVAADLTTAIWIHNTGCSPTVQNTVLHGGGGSKASYGMYNVDSTPIVRSNLINGGSSPTSSIGLENLSNRAKISFNTIDGGSGNVSEGVHNYFGYSDFVLKNNIIYGGNGNSGAWGVSIETAASPTVENNIISGGVANLSYGLYIRKSTPIVKGNTLSGGNGGSIAAAIYITDASPVVLHNTLKGGNAIENSYGIYNVSSSPTIRYNTIDGGNGLSVSTGISYALLTSPPIVQNNVISGGNGDQSFGIRGSDTSTVIQNNIINGGSGKSSSFGISGPHTPMVDNNIIFTSSNTSSATYCIYEEAPGGAPASVRNNNLFSCKTIYRDIDAGCTGNGDGDADDTTCTLIELEALSDANAGSVGNNVSTDPVFVNINGLDDNISTLDDNNWHFSNSSPFSVTTGGLNGEDEGGWGFKDDKDGLSRPGTGVNWSMGAYEP